MNTRLIPNLNSRNMRITYVAIVVSILLIASISVAFTPTAAAKKRKKIKATGEITSFNVPSTCGVVDGYVGCLASEYVDNQHIWTRNALHINTGTIMGNSSSLDVAIAYLDEGIPTVADFTGISIFRGTVGDSEPGTFTTNGYFTVDYRAFFAGTGLLTWEGRILVIEGSGTGGLEGICGVVDFQGSLTLEGAITTYDGEFRFDKDCKKLNLAD